MGKLMSFADEIFARPGPVLGSAGALRGNPLDVFARLAIAENMDCERVSPNELHLTLAGLWCIHDVSIIWDTEREQIDLVLLFDTRAPGGRSDDICRLLSLLNERLRSGHFDFWNNSDSMVYRNALSLAGGARLKIEQAMAMLAGALDAAERGYPACQYVLWAGKTPEEAMDTTLMDIAVHG